MTNAPELALSAEEKRAFIEWQPDVLKGAGRPTVPLLIGQQAYAKVAYQRFESQADISLRTNVTLPRLRRYLRDQGLYREKKVRTGEERLGIIQRAVSQYLDGHLVMDICSTNALNPAELYRELHLRGVPLRRPAAEAAPTPVLKEEVQNAERIADSTEVQA